MHWSLSGSSPLTRGALQQVDTWRYFKGIIPAYAGSTRSSALRLAKRRDHPRLRGEHGGCKLLLGGISGSSPLTRGAHVRAAHWSHFWGIIPAYAGSTRLRLAKLPGLEDHPRLRGEHACSYVLHVAAMGSSPLTRGAHCASPSTIAIAGIIPAYAGSTQS